jgi:hypothetical protein
MQLPDVKYPTQIPSISPTCLPIFKEPLNNINFADIDFYNPEILEAKSEKNPLLRYLCREAACIGKMVSLV